MEGFSKNNFTLEKGKPLSEGYEKRGGVKDKPISPRPAPPKGIKLNEPSKSLSSGS